MTKKLHSLLFLALCVGLIGCAPSAPPDIPRDASRHWSLKGSFYWTWSDDLENGCVAWMADDSYAHLFAFVDSRCEGRLEPTFRKGKKGLSYTSFSDYLIFLGYWPWTAEIYHDLLNFDDEGMLTESLPCPYSLPQEEIDALRAVVAEALLQDLTDGERRMFARVDERLSETNGSALDSSQTGCTDLPPNQTGFVSREKVDPWVSR